MPDAEPLGRMFQQIRRGTTAADAPADPGDPEHRSRTFAVVRREATANRLFERLPRYATPLALDVRNAVKGAISTPLLLLLTGACLVLGAPLNWIGGIVFGFPAVVSAVFCGLAYRRVRRVRLGPVRTEVARLRMDDAVRPSVKDQLADELDDQPDVWLETASGERVRVPVADGLYVELPLDGWGVAFLKGGVLVDFARVRVPHVTEGRLDGGRS